MMRAIMLMGWWGGQELWQDPHNNRAKTFRYDVILDRVSACSGTPCFLVGELGIKL